MIYISLNAVGAHGLNVRRIDHEQMYHFSELLAVECAKKQHQSMHSSIVNRIKILANYHKLPDNPMTPVINMNLGVVTIVELYRLTASIVARLAAVSASNCARELNDGNFRRTKVIVNQPEFERLSIMLDILETFSFCVSVGTSVTLSQQATPKLARVH
jgi:hypothetical protein